MSTTAVHYQLVAVIGLLNEIVSAGLDRDAMCALVAERAMMLTKSTGAAIELEDGEHMVCLKACGTATTAAGLRLPKKSTLSGRCMEMQLPLASDDTENDPQVDAATCKRVGAASLVCVPLFHQDKAIGVLAVVSNEKRHFNDSDMGTLAAVGERHRLINGECRQVLRGAARKPARSVDRIVEPQSVRPGTGDRVQTSEAI